MADAPRTARERLEGRGRSSSLGGYLLLYSAMFALAATVLLLGHLWHHRSLVMSSDGWEQHLKALAFYGQWLRSVARGIVSGELSSLPTYATSLGYGSDVIGTLHYYAIGDPLNLLSALVPLSATPRLYEVLIFVRLYLAGLACGLFARDVVRPRPTSLAAATGALSYAFVGFALTSATMHPFFINPMISFPLMIWGVERELRGEGCLLFALGTLHACVCSFYFLFAQVLLASAFILWRLWERLGPSDLHGLVRHGVRLLAAGLVAALVSAAVLVPSVTAFLGSSRSGTGMEYGLLYDARYYVLFVLGLASAEHAIGSWSSLGLNPAVLLAVVALFALPRRRDRGGLRLLVVVLLAFHLLPFFGALFNGLSYPSHRWTWAIALLTSYLLVELWPDLCTLDLRRKLTLVGVAVGYTILQSLLSSFSGYLLAGGLIEATIGMAMAVALAVGPKDPARAPVLRGGLLAGLALLAVLANIWTMYASSHGNHAAKFRTPEAVAGYLRSDASRIEEVADDSSFYRVASDNSDPNGSALTGTSSIAYYWSVTGARLDQLNRALYVKTSLSQRIYGVDRRAVLEELACVGYYLSRWPEGMPYGFEEIPGSYEGSGPAAGTIYRNTRALPFGFTYGGYVAREDFDALAPVDRQWALLQGAVLEDGAADVGGLTRLSPSSTSVRVPSELTVGEGVSLDGDGTFDVARGGASVTLAFEGLPDAETYCLIEGLDYEFHDAEGTERTLAQRLLAEPARETLLTLEFGAGGRLRAEKNVVYRSSDHRWYEDRHDYAVNSGYFTEPMDSVTITFSRPGRYAIDDLAVICQPMEGYDAHVAALAQDAMTDVDFHYARGLAVTSRVTGRIELDETRLLMFSLPHADGWSVTVDGEPRELLQADIAYMGVVVEPGSHDIALSYRTPGLGAGVLLSAVGIVASLAWGLGTLVLRRRSTGGRPRARGPRRPSRPEGNRTP